MSEPTPVVIVDTREQAPLDIRAYSVEVANVAEPRQTC